MLALGGGKGLRGAGRGAGGALAFQFFGQARQAGGLQIESGDAVALPGERQGQLSAEAAAGALIWIDRERLPLIRFAEPADEAGWFLQGRFG